MSDLSFLDPTDSKSIRIWGDFLLLNRHISLDFAPRKGLETHPSGLHFALRFLNFHSASVLIPLRSKAALRAHHDGHFLAPKTASQSAVRRFMPKTKKWGQKSINWAHKIALR